MASRRVLITGLSTFWGGRLARAVEQKPEVEAIIGVDNRDPTVELERTEFVRVGAQHALIRRIVQAAEIDTVIDTRLVVDSTTTSPALAHENNVIGTMNILAGCSGADSPVRRLVLKSSAHWYGCEQDDPSFFTEEMDRPHPPRTPIEKDIVEAERAVSQFAASSPGSSVSAIAARVVSLTTAKDTPRSCARSTKSARSPPESCTLAMPRAAPPTRRGELNSSIASAISSSVSTSCTPYASKSASYAPCSPASAPECAVTMAFEPSVRPTFRAITGTSSSSARASCARNPAGSRTVSSRSASTRVSARPRA